MHCLYLKIPKSSIVGDAISKSTLHGLPRLVAARSTIVRVFWIILLIGSFTVFGIHLESLAKKFWNEGIVTSTNLQGDHFRFPDIFICHKIALAQSYFVDAANSPVGTSKRGKLDDIMKLINRTRSLFYDLKSEIGEPVPDKIIADVHIFWETQNWNDIMNLLAHKLYQTITTITVRSGRPLDVLKTVRVVPNPIYFYCFAITIPEDMMDPMDQHVHFSIYADEDEDPHFKNLLRVLGMNFDFRHGLRVYFGEHGSTPNFESQFIHIRPGFFYDIRLEMEYFNRYDASRRPCFYEEPKFTSVFDWSKDESQYNMYKTCLDNDKQEAFVKKCGCFDVWLTDGWISKSIRDKYTSCFNLTSVYNGYVEDYHQDKAAYNTISTRFKCFVDFRKEYPDEEAQDKCSKKIPCKWVRYLPEWSFMEWPAAEDANEALNKTVRKPMYNRMLHNLSTPGLQSQLEKSNTTDTVVENMRSTISMIKVRPSEFFSTVITERQQYPIINFFSDVGGILGLYVGASVLTIFEFFEIFFNFFRTIAVGRKQNSMTTDKNKNERNNTTPSENRNDIQGYDNRTFWI